MKKVFCPCRRCKNREIPQSYPPCAKCSVEDWNMFEAAKMPIDFVTPETFSFSNMPGRKNDGNSMQ